MQTKWTNILALGGFFAASAAVATIGGIATAGNVGSWYAALVKPSFNPPNWLFGPVWTVLYVMMAVAAWRVWRTAHPGRLTALSAYGAQLALNLTWSLLFFGLQRPDLAFFEILVLIGLVIVTTRLFWTIERPAALLMLPYLAWIGFATLLNLAIWRLN